MKFLIVGLGNPGSEYTNTRHNIGFKVLDALVDASNTSFRAERLGDIAQYRVKNKQLILLKPTTFMNLSGKAVNYWLQKEKIPVDRKVTVIAITIPKIPKKLPCLDVSGEDKPLRARINKTPETR